MNKKLVVFCLISAFAFTVQSSYAVSHHTKKNRNYQNPKSGRVVLTPQPANNFSTIAYNLNKTDINFAVQHGEKPLILIGNANLSSTKKPQTVLFTQLQSASLCGSGGCTTTAYLNRNNHWVKILDSVTGNIEIKKTSHKGMHDLIVEGSDVWIWNKTTYVETQQGPNLNGLKKSIHKYQKNRPE